MNAVDDDAALNEAAYFERLHDLATRRAKAAATRRRRCTAAAAS